MNGNLNQLRPLLQVLLGNNFISLNGNILCVRNPIQGAAAAGGAAGGAGDDVNTNNNSNNLNDTLSGLIGRLQDLLDANEF